MRRHRPLVVEVGRSVEEELHLLLSVRVRDNGGGISNVELEQVEVGAVLRPLDKLVHVRASLDTVRVGVVGKIEPGSLDMLP